MCFFDRLDKNLEKKLREEFDEAGMGYWIVKVRLRNGDIWRNVILATGYLWGFRHNANGFFRLRDVVDVWNVGAEGRSQYIDPIKVE